MDVLVKLFLFDKTLVKPQDTTNCVNPEAKHQYRTNVNAFWANLKARGCRLSSTSEETPQ
jgi:hypothetical protein